MDTQLSVYKASSSGMSLGPNHMQGYRSTWRVQFMVTKGSDRTLRKSSISKDFSK